MIHSMTAFARIAGDTPAGELTWELRAVNHRFFESSIRLPEELRALDPAVRERLGARLARGKIDGVLRYVARRETATAHIDTALLEQVLTAARAIAQRDEALVPLSVGEVLRWPGLLLATEPDLEALGAQALALLDQALDLLVATRAREGERLRTLILQRCDRLAAEAARVQTRLPEVRATQRQRLLDRFAEAQLELEPTRLEQELLLLAQRGDVAEEIERLQVHLAAVRDALDGAEPSGRRLDFLMQELHREANTLASKSADAEVTRTTVEMKVLIEQMREQAQNIE